MARRRRARRRVGRRRNIRRGRGNKMLNGGMIRGRMHPPENSASPWNNFVVTFLWSPTKPASGSFVTLQDLMTSQVRDQVRTELGLSGGVDMRIRRIDVWTQPQTSNSTRNTIVMAPYDWTTCGGILNWYESWGTSVQPAHCHYVWPKSISNVVLSDGKSCAVARFDVRDENFAYIIKCHLTWRKNAPNPLRATGEVTSLRTQVKEKPPDDGFEHVEVSKAISPLAIVVDALNLRS